MSLGLVESGILVAIYSGSDSLDKLERMFPTLDREALQQTLHSLEARGLLKREQRGLLFKKEVYKLTPAGVKHLDQAQEKLHQAAQEARERLSTTAPPREEMPTVLGDLYLLLPLLLFLGLLPPTLAAPEAQAISEEEGEDLGEEAGEDLEAGEADIIDIEPL